MSGAGGWISLLIGCWCEVVINHACAACPWQNVYWNHAEVLVRQFLGWFASLSTLGFVGRSGPGAWGTPTVDLQTAADGLYFALRWHVELDSQDEGLLHKSQSIQHHQRMFFGKCISEAAGQTCFVLSCLFVCLFVCFVCCLCSLCWQMCYHHECL